MKTKESIVAVALLSSLTLMSGAVSAADPEYPTNPEHSFIADPAPPARTRAEVRAELDAYRLDSAAPDGWKDVGGERGVKFVGGNFAGGDSGSASHTWTTADQMMASLYYRNTQ